MFSFTHAVKIELKGNNNQYCIYDGKDKLPTFGGGHDVTLYSNCTSNNSSYSNLNHTYKDPAIKDVGFKDVLGGSYNFKAEDVEVWLVKNVKKP